jgi:hypothetical protein
VEIAVSHWLKTHKQKAGPLGRFKRVWKTPHQYPLQFYQRLVEGDEIGFMNGDVAKDLCLLS